MKETADGRPFLFVEPKVAELPMNLCLRLQDDLDIEAAEESRQSFEPCGAGGRRLLTNLFHRETLWAWEN